jgi:hypothetical protein
MKTTTFAVALLGLFPAIFAQETLAPSPTESVGCEPHGDHCMFSSPIDQLNEYLISDIGHCDGARSTLATEAKATTDAEHDDDHDHDHDHDTTGTESLAPSPTESTGCEPHGDHWHCEAAKTGSMAKATNDHDDDDDHDHDDEDHSHSAGATKSLSPSPTESIGCEPHGDHCMYPSSLPSCSFTDSCPRALRRSCYRCSYCSHCFRLCLCLCHRE